MADAEALADDGKDLEESGDEPAKLEDGAGAAKKKKRKKKKKAGADAGDADAGAEEAAGADEGAPAATSEGDAPPEAPVAPEADATPSPAADGDEEDEDNGGEGEAAAGAAAKKKKKKKKKPSGVGGCGEIEKEPGVKLAFAERRLQLPDVDAFNKFCADSIERTRPEATKGMAPAELLKPPRAFWGYSYTGPLRPAFVAPQQSMNSLGIDMPDYATHQDGYAASERSGPKEVPVLTGDDLRTMREACTLGREVLDVAARFMRAGVTGDEIDRVVFQACVDRNIYPSPLNYYKFPKCLCVSANEVICHGIPDCRPLEEGDIVNLDISIYHKGFHSDLNETYFIGQCDEESQKLVRTAYNCLHAASKLIRPGTFYRDLGNSISAEAARNNCSVVTSYCGHGVGALFHGPPKVPHYKKNKAVGIMKPGHVFTVEPMINLGSNPGDKTWPDNWTAVTKDGKRSAQFEHTFLVTEEGVEVLTSRQGASRQGMPDFEPLDFQC